jgi:hypothetical protein
MSAILTELFDCLFELPDGFFEREVIKNNLEKQDYLMEEICKILPIEKKNLIYDYEVSIHDVLQDEVLEAFKQGIKIGFLLKKEVIE